MKKSEQKKIRLARERMKKCRNKSDLAKKLGIARSSLYYRPKKPKEDEQIKEQILEVLLDHPAYGHKRIALDLGLNKKRILRIMKSFGIRPRILRGKPSKKDDLGNLPSKVPNLAKTLCPIRPNVLWAGDFTYLRWEGGFVYVATVLDVYTRQIMGWHIGLRHTTDLVLQALGDAVRRSRQTPKIFHSDQGSEYLSGRYEKMLEIYGITPSHAKKSSPWENGYQESFYSQFKLELGKTNRFSCLGELAEAVHKQICYYNEKRIHTSIKMPPNKFYLQHLAKQKTAYLAV